VSSNGSDRFVKHEPCPKCGSRDNLGVWEDGHKFCFGCKYYVPPTPTLDQLKRKTMENNKNNVVSSIDTSGFTAIIPVRAVTWLKKYGITDIEIQHYRLLWDTYKDSLVFPLFDERGSIVLTNSRYFGPNPDHPKYITNGHKSRNTVYIRNRNTPTTLVLVEDFVSALKVARQASSIPLFGSTVSPECVKWASGTFKQLRIWLDMDKASQSLLEASKLSQYCPDSRVILTPLDPKEYSNNQIYDILTSHGVKFTESA